MSKSWDDFDKFDSIINKYMEPCGEGETEASQVVTAVNKLIYKWYNDGDVYDNTYILKGWCNDLSSYANWLWRYAGGDVDADKILERIEGCYTEGDYEDLLYDLAECLLDEEYLELMAGYKKTGSIYNCNGIFKFVDEPEEDDEDDDYYERW